MSIFMFISKRFIKKKQSVQALHQNRQAKLQNRIEGTHSEQLNYTCPDHNSKN